MFSSGARRLASRLTVPPLYVSWFPKYRAATTGNLAPMMTIQSPSKTVELHIGGIDYRLIPCDRSELLGTFDVSKVEHLPVTVIPVAKGSISTSALKDFNRSRLEVDDVHQRQFLTYLIFQGPEASADHLEDSAKELLDSWGVHRYAFIPTDQNRDTVGGPFILSKAQVYEPWRLYEDRNSTFLMTFTPKSSQENSDLHELSSVFGSTEIRACVPSRVYYEKSKEKPLAGSRLVVKDNFDIEGFRTSICSKSWLKYYDAATSTAPCIEQLLKKGAVLIAKAKLQAWIIREEPLEAVEFFSPFNPRGDGYQNPSGSSSGSGAAMGAYSWIDIAVGSDTNGSGRKPGTYNGCHTIRPTLGALPMQGVVGFWPRFDMPAIFCRDLSRFQNIISTWYGQSSIVKKSRFAKVIVPTEYLTDLHPGQYKALEALASSLAKQIGSSSFEKLSLAEKWLQDKPDTENDEPPEKYLVEAGCVPFYYDSVKVYMDFFEDFKNKFGEAPYMHKHMKWRWGIREKYNGAQRDALYKRLEIYKTWLLGRVLEYEASKQQGNLIVMAIEKGKPNYRDDIGAYSLLNGFDTLNVSPISGAPEITVIAGETPYQSRVTEREEPKPIGISICGPPGSDADLCDIAYRAAKAASLPVKLSVGRSIYPDTSGLL